MRNEIYSAILNYLPNMIYIPRTILRFLKNSYSAEYIFFTGTIFYAVLLRVWNLATFPSLINGDESYSMIHAWQLLYGLISPFQFAADGNSLVFIYYPKVFMILLVGIENSLLAVRLTTALMSVGVVIMFYFILRNFISSYFVASLMSILLASSYWFLNFSRISWINVEGLFFGLLLYMVILRMLEPGRHIRYPIMLGIISALLLVHYMGIRIYLVLGIILLTINLPKMKYKVLKVSLFVIFFMVSMLPFIQILLSQSNNYLLRARTVSIFNLQESYYGLSPLDKAGILGHQIKYATKGIILFTGSVSSEGHENGRYIPYKTAAINRFVWVLFAGGLVLSIIRRRFHFLLAVYIVSILLVQIPTVYIPNWSRAIGILPAIYLYAGYGLNELYRLSLRYVHRSYAAILFFTIVVVLSLSDVKTYWNHITSSEFYQSQGPAINLSELYDWQSAQLSWIKKANTPFTYYDWFDPEFRLKVSTANE